MHYIKTRRSYRVWCAICGKSRYLAKLTPFLIAGGTWRCAKCNQWSIDTLSR